MTVRGGQKQQGGLHALPVKGGSFTFASYNYLATTAWFLLFVGFLTNLITWNTENRSLLLATLVLLQASFALQTWVRWSLIGEQWLPLGLLLAAAILTTVSQATETFTPSNIAVFLEIVSLFLNSVF